MKHRLIMTAAMAALVLGGTAACGRGEPEGPTPEEMRQDSLQLAEEARQDSLRRAEQARQDSLAQAGDQDEVAVRATEAAREILEDMIHFGYDQTMLTAEAEQKLTRKVAVMRANPDVRLRIAGHADERGSIEYNRALGQRRAEAAREYMVNYGISPDRLNTVSFGEDRPLVNASNEQAWAENRRNEFHIMAGGDQMRVPGGP